MMSVLRAPDSRGHLEFRGFRRLAPADWARRKAKQESHRKHEMRTDIYCILPDPAFNVKLRWGSDFEVKELVHRRQDGVEAWRRSVSMPLLPGAQHDVHNLEKVLLSEAARHATLQEVARMLAAEREAGRPARLVVVEKIRKRLSSAGAAEKTTLRITIGDDVHFYETFCAEGREPRRSAKLTALIEGCEHVGAYSSFLKWLVTQGAKRENNDTETNV